MDSSNASTAAAATASPTPDCSRRWTSPTPTTTYYAPDWPRSATPAHLGLPHSARPPTPTKPPSTTSPIKPDLPPEPNTTQATHVTQDPRLRRLSFANQPRQRIPSFRE